LSPTKKAASVSSTSRDVDGLEFDKNFVDKNEIDETLVDEEAARPKRVPRRVLHFSDGILEEYRQVFLKPVSIHLQ